MYKWLLISMSLVLLYACGGGGGGASSNPTPTATNSGSSSNFLQDHDGDNGSSGGGSGSSITLQAPSNLVATPLSTTSIKLTWVDNSNNEAGFKIERKNLASANYTVIATVLPNTTQYIDTGLLPGVTYYYRVCAYETIYGQTAYSNETQATTPSPLLPPFNLQLQLIFPNSAKLTWQDNSNNETGFKIERQIPVISSNFIEIATVGANVTSYTVTGLAPGITYNFRVKAFHEYDVSPPSNIVSVTIPLAVKAPYPLITYETTSNSVTLLWKDNSTNETGFQIERKTGEDDVFTLIATVSPNTTSYTDSNLSWGTTYYYRVKAVGSNGVSAYSNKIPVRTAAPGWKIYTVDYSAQTGLYASSTIDTVGNIHLAYFDNTNKDVMYAYSTDGGNSWAIEAADNNASKVREISIAASNLGIYIFYYDAKDKNLVSLSKTFSGWTKEVIDTDGSGRYISATADNNGNIHISYYDTKNKDLKYGFYNGNQWQISTVATDGDIGKYSSIVVGEDGKVHISCFNDKILGGKLYYFAKDGDTWTSEVVDKSWIFSVGMYSRIGLDQGQPVIVYLAPHLLGGKLKLAKKVETGWTFEEVYNSWTSTPKYPSFVANYINFYRDKTFGGELWLAKKTGEIWESSSVDIDADVGKYANMIKASNNTLYITYYDSTNGDLKIAKSADGTIWQKFIVDGMGNKGYYTSIGLDQDGYPRIAYYEKAKKDLKHAQFFSLTSGSSTFSGWYLATVDSSGDVGKYTSIDVKDYTSHISYFDKALGGSVKYAKGEFNSWQTEYINTLVAGNFKTDIAVDEEGGVHFAYPRFLTMIQYTLKTSTGTTTEIVEPFLALPNPSITISSWGTPRIAYGRVAQPFTIDFTEGGDVSFQLSQTQGIELIYARQTYSSYTSSTMWLKETVQDLYIPVGDYLITLAGLFTSIDLNSIDKPFVSYYAPLGGAKVARQAGSFWTGSFWISEFVYPLGGWYNSMKVHETGIADVPYVAHYDPFFGKLICSWRIGQIADFIPIPLWMSVPVDLVGRNGQYSDIALGSDGSVHISYKSPWGLKYAKKS